MYCLRGVTQKVLPIYRFLYIGFFCIAYQVSHKRFYQSTASYIRDFSFINTLRRFGMYLNHNSQSLFGEYRSMPGVLNYWFYIFILVYCLPVVTQMVLPIYRILYIAFSVLSTRCHTKGPTNLQVIIYVIFLLRLHQEDLGFSSTTTSNHYLESTEVCRAS